MSSLGLTRRPEPPVSPEITVGELTNEQKEALLLLVEERRVLARRRVTGGRRNTTHLGAVPLARAKHEVEAFEDLAYYGLCDRHLLTKHLPGYTEELESFGITFEGELMARAMQEEGSP